MPCQVSSTVAGGPSKIYPCAPVLNIRLIKSLTDARTGDVCICMILYTYVSAEYIRVTCTRRNFTHADYRSCRALAVTCDRHRQQHCREESVCRDINMTEQISQAKAANLSQALCSCLLFLLCQRDPTEYVCVCVANINPFTVRDPYRGQKNSCHFCFMALIGAS